MEIRITVRLISLFQFIRSAKYIQQFIIKRGHLFERSLAKIKRYFRSQVGMLACVQKSGRHEKQQNGYSSFMHSVLLHKAL